MHALLTAQQVVRVKLGRMIGLPACKARLKFLLKRYEAWRHVLGSAEVGYDQVENRVHGPEWAWEWLAEVCVLRCENLTLDLVTWLTMMQENPMALAYYFDGEPEFAKLEEIFGEHRRFGGTIPKHYAQY